MCLVSERDCHVTGRRRGQKAKTKKSDVTALPEVQTMLLSGHRRRNMNSMLSRMGLKMCCRVCHVQSSKTYHLLGLSDTTFRMSAPGAGGASPCERVTRQTSADRGSANTGRAQPAVSAGDDAAVLLWNNDQNAGP
ncbi:hypothetical protein EVAR_18330_1 [Eumeta japonica]|uniref:Uncharacterized protein n=1 Tax=Eumeta variegata TaxID=151549 RepID=A0A4C1VC63_EUMVA|nr:hypothetical protein EVAR_18330_1 [Eumeta japonica]